MNQLHVHMYTYKIAEPKQDIWHTVHVHVTTYMYFDKMNAEMYMYMYIRKTFNNAVVACLAQTWQLTKLILYLFLSYQSSAQSAHIHMYTLTN